MKTEEETDHRGTESTEIGEEKNRLRRSPHAVGPVLCVLCASVVHVSVFSTGNRQAILGAA